MAARSTQAGAVWRATKGRCAAAASSAHFNVPRPSPQSVASVVVAAATHCAASHRSQVAVSMRKVAGFVCSAWGSARWRNLASAVRVTWHLGVCPQSFSGICMPNHRPSLMMLGVLGSSPNLSVRTPVPPAAMRQGISGLPVGSRNSSTSPPRCLARPRNESSARTVKVGPGGCPLSTWCTSTVLTAGPRWSMPVTMPETIRGALATFSSVSVPASLTPEVVVQEMRSSARGASTTSPAASPPGPSARRRGTACGCSRWRPRGWPPRRRSSSPSR